MPLFKRQQPDPEVTDPEFREEIAALSRSGLRIATLVGISLPSLLIAVSVIVLQTPVAWIGVPGVSTAIWDEAAIALLAAGLLLLSAFAWTIRNARWIFILFVWLAATVILVDDLVHTGQLHSTNYLALLVLVAVGTMPFRRRHVLVLGSGMLALYLGLARAAQVPLDINILFFLGLLIPLGIWIVGLLSDARIRRHELLRRTMASEERYRSLFDDASDGIFTIDNGTGRFLEVNPALERMLGVAAADLRQMEFLSIVHPDDRALVTNHHVRRIRGEDAPAQYQFRVIAPASGNVHVCDVAIHTGGIPLLTSGIARDLTERIRAEQTIRDYAAELEVVNREIVATQARLLQAEKNSAMAHLVAGVVHELNSPLAAVQCNVDLAARAAAMITETAGAAAGPAQDTDSRLSRCFETMRSACDATRAGLQRISAVVKTLRSFAHLDQAERRPIDINTCISDALRLLQYQVQDRIKIVTQLEVLPPYLCEARNITELVTIIIKRAIDGIAATGAITVATQVADNAIKITVADTGTTLTPDECRRLFDPRFSVQNQRVGLGLELPIAQHIAVDHGGTIEIASTLESGNLVLVTLPIPAS